MRDATIDRILQPSLGFVRDGDCSLRSISQREVQQELREIARPEDLVDCCKVRRALFMAEVRGEDAAPDTLPPQEFASSTGRAKTCHLGLWKSAVFLVATECNIPLAYKHQNEERVDDTLMNNKNGLVFLMADSFHCNLLAQSFLSTHSLFYRQVHSIRKTKDKGANTIANQFFSSICSMI